VRTVGFASVSVDEVVLGGGCEKEESREGSGRKERIGVEAAEKDDGGSWTAREAKKERKNSCGTMSGFSGPP
jgi:hypothetical protein